MHHLPIKPSVPLILMLFLSGCAHQITPELTPPSEQATACSTAPQATKSMAPTQKPQRGQNQPDGQRSDATQSLDFGIPAHPLDVILGRPTSNSMTFSLLAHADQAVSIAYGTVPGSHTSQTEAMNLAAGSPQSIALGNLQPNTRYFYAINGGSENSFHTARPAGSTFTFTVQADSHLDSNTDTEVYLQTLANQRADHPDFVIDLGDTFMTDKYQPYTDAVPQYLAQRYFFGQLADTAPLFLVLGNHDGEGAARGKYGEEMPAWSAQQRKLYFPNPAPNDFYTGNATPHATAGDLQDYYAWTWGDALFITLDPYWFSPATTGATIDLWNPTLGEEQYRWLKSTLERSDAKWKFIFIHQLIGALDRNGRGGVEAAPFHEWGGYDPNGAYVFEQYRPNWGLPIHQLLLATNVTAVFHGHDHLFVKQELDGVIYQECPQPGASQPNTNSAVEYGYTSGDVLASPGHLRVTVSPQTVSVDYVRSSLSTDQNGQVAYSYSILP